MEFLPCFLSIYLYVDSMVLNGHVRVEGTVSYVLDVFHFWLVHLQFHYLVVLNGL